MKFVTLNLLAAALLLFSISSANAFRVDGHWTPSIWRLQYEDESSTSYLLLPGDSVSLEVTFDTTYSYRENGEGCGHLHVRLLVALGTWLDSLGIGWIWSNEFTGERHEGYDQLPELAGGGDEASAWFADKVLPVLRKEATWQS